MTSPTSMPSVEEARLKPCPFCGAVGLTFGEGSTFRWRIAECKDCGATCGEERIQTQGAGTREEWEAEARTQLIATWNTRAESEEVRKLREDAERLDFLEAAQKPVRPLHLVGRHEQWGSNLPAKFIGWTVDGNAGESSTVRAAIDAARASLQHTNEGERS